jgi:hypothetical protein
LDFAYAQQQTRGVLEKDQFLQEIEQQHVDLFAREIDPACFSRLNRLDIVDHHVGHCVSRVAEQLRQIAPSRFKGDIGCANVLQVCVRHGAKNNEIPMSNTESSSNLIAGRLCQTPWRFTETTCKDHSRFINS